MKYARYNRVAADLGIPEDMLQGNLIADPDRQARVSHGQRDGHGSGESLVRGAPPDLTLVARARKPEWLYTYLRTFYRDDTPSLRRQQPGIPERRHAARAARLQGMPECVPTAEHSEMEPLSGTEVESDHDMCGSLEVAEGQHDYRAVRQDRLRSGELSCLRRRAYESGPPAYRHLCAAVLSPCSSFSLRCSTANTGKTCTDCAPSVRCSSARVPFSGL
jgi:cytochrome c1